MKKLLLMAGLLATAIGAQAQFAAAGSQSQSGSTADAGAVAGSVAGANSNIGITIQAADPLARTTVEQAGKLRSVYAPAVVVTGPASGPCTGRSGGIGGSGMGFGIGANFAEVDASCTLRENIRVMAMILPTMPMGTPAHAKLQRQLNDMLDRLVAEAPGAGPVAAPKVAALSDEQFELQQYALRN